MLFTMEVELGGDAMKSAEELANAIKDVAGRVLSTYGDIQDIETPVQGKVRNSNMETVGTWSVTE